MSKYLILINNQIYGIEKSLYVNINTEKGKTYVEFPFDAVIYAALKKCGSDETIYINAHEFVSEVSSKFRKVGDKILIEVSTTVSTFLQSNHPYLRKFKIHDFIHDKTEPEV
jgi:hypothetical protein